MHSTIGHYRHPGKFQSHIGVPAAKPKFHAFIGMPRPQHATGEGITRLSSQPHEYRFPNQAVQEARSQMYDQLTPGPQR